MFQKLKDMVTLLVDSFIEAREARIKYNRSRL
jgi:hypothetical protein